MEILQEDNSRRGSFFVQENGKRLAELAYTWRDDHVISIDHTEVDESFEGRGVGSSLVEHTVMFARETGLKVKLYCPFAQQVFERHKEYGDVLTTD
jgi:predicted GNAT family acetyltransferase